MAEHNKTGASGEELACRYLEEKGYTILHRNWRYSHYEIDIIAEKNDRLHFIEVKTRRSQQFGMPEDALSRRKIKNLIEAADEYIHLTGIIRNIQFDCLAINLYKNSFNIFLLEDIYISPV